MSLLIIGVGKGLGLYLTKEMRSFQEKITVSRSEIDTSLSTVHIQCSSHELHYHLHSLEKESVDLVIYLPSAWGETGEMELLEYKNFMNIGPNGLLSSFNALKDQNILKQGSLFINIGSTASEEALSTRSGTSYSLYSIAKLTQKSIISKLAQTNDKYRFATITLGSIGEDRDIDGIGYRNIKDTIEYLYNLSEGAAYTDIELVAKKDII